MVMGEQPQDDLLSEWEELVRFLSQLAENVEQEKTKLQKNLYDFYAQDKIKRKILKDGQDQIKRRTLTKIDSFDVAGTENKKFDFYSLQSASVKEIEELLQKAEKCVANAEARAQKIREEDRQNKPPAKVYKWFIVISLILGVPALIAYTIRINIYPSIIDALLFILLFGVIMYGILCIFARPVYRLIKKLTAPSKYAALAEQLNQAEYWYDRAVEKAGAIYKADMATLIKRFSPLVAEAVDRVRRFKTKWGADIAIWEDLGWQEWAPATLPPSAVRFGTLELASADFQADYPTVDIDFVLPALLPFTGGRGLLLEAAGQSKKDKERAAAALQSLAFRLLATVPPGKLRFTFIDPVDLGQNVRSLLPLADYEESLISSRCWSEPQHIEQRLGELTEHMENVIQKYLRDDYATIEDYNAQAGEVAEPYRIVMVFDFPVNFTEEAARRLVSIARHGPRCGVYALVVMNTNEKTPYGFNLTDLRQACNVISLNKGQFKWEDFLTEDWRLELDQPPEGELAKKILAGVGERAREAMKVEVPYPTFLKQAGLTQDRWWQGEAGEKIAVPLGPAGARKLQQLTLGQGTANHVLVVGQTGSGKSNLLHIIITTLALAYPPDEVKLYLVDFKKGVEFKPYAETSLPHAVVIAIESEREFGLSVLQGLDQELQQRGELFRSVGANSLSEYRQKVTENKRLPRILLIVDEFQEFFTQEDAISRQAALVLDRLVRQGRAFGLHVLLGSQTLAGSYSLPRSTLDQMAVRIALQCTEADSRLILADDNPAARLLSRPGEAIYNAATGLVEGNSLFQVALFSEEDRSLYLKLLAAKAEEARKNGKTYPPPVIFEGHEPARLEFCQPLNKLLAAASWPPAVKTGEAWIGEPLAIRPPVALRLHRQSGSHLLVITREEAEGIGLLTAALLSLAAQLRPEAARFYILNLTLPDSPWVDLAEEMANLLPHQITVLGRRDLPAVFGELGLLVNQRLEEGKAAGPTVYFLLLGLHRARDLRLEESSLSFSFGEEKGLALPDQFANLLREGPEVGIHFLAWCDTYTSLRRVVDRRRLGEFALRVAGPMSSEDSVNFLDDPAASRLDKPHRLLFYDEERPGYLEKFRPYALPERAWLKAAAEKLRTRAGGN